ncbi:MAG: formate--phosphoribosylaminoimidazolecarboxamide ligase [Aigarchaeota archaeon]|nr:formate--phosphoribosylaminoimidazolecarboxamide ligase [Aigarchaeota archaeon]MDW8021609.1 formate--phosphoribosylaminoimidazolecarboxamide ligase [Nitrososphaerota archaeon]
MISRERIMSALRNYSESDIKVATICSHSSLQIFHGARLEGFATLGITLPRNRPYYESFPTARPDIILEVERYGDILSDDFQRRLIEENAIIIPHGSFVEYVGAQNILEKFYVPMFGNRLTLLWEGDRRKQRHWFQEAGVAVPKYFNDPSEIDRPSIVKLHGAKGGHGYFNASSPEEFNRKFEELRSKGLIDREADVVIEEFVPGVRYYPHFFISPLGNPNLPNLTHGSLELLGIDRRLEVIDEVYRGLPKIMEEYLDYTVTGNLPVVVREKFVVDLLEAAAKIASASRKLFNPGLIGPFCLEMIYHPKRGFVVFEVSARIVAGTNLYPLGSPYSPYYYSEPMSMGRRIARELKTAIRENKLHELIH